MDINWSIETNIFSSPSGNIRGIVIGLFGNGKKSKRVLHATLLTDGTPKITTSVLDKGSTIADLESYSDLLKAFAKELTDLA